jgi:hypothetical protein
MANSFLDTSALVKYYHSEEGTVEVTRLVQERDSTISPALALLKPNTVLLSSADRGNHGDGF